MRQRPAQVLAQAGPDLAGEGARLLQLVVEVLRTVRQPEGFEPQSTARRVLAHQHEVARVRHQHQPVAVPIPAHLLAGCREPRIFPEGSAASEGGADSPGGATSQGSTSPGGGARSGENTDSGRSTGPGRNAASGGGAASRRLHLHHPALRRLPLARAAPLHLPRRVQAEVRMARALVGQLAHAEHLGLQRRSDRVQQVRERPVARPLPGRPARGVDSPEVGEVRLDRRRQSRARAPHPSSSLLPPRAVRAQTSP